MTGVQSISGVERCNQFIDGVLSGAIPAPLNVRLACERHKRDKDNPALDFRPDLANAAVGAIEKLKHAKGRWQGQPIRLEPWQCFVVCSLFGWRWVKSQKRRFRYGYLQTPRKQGKSLLAICIALVMFGPDEERGAEVFLGSTSQEHARDILFGPARYIVKSCESYRKRFGVEINATSLVIPANFSTLKAVIKKPDDGSNPHCAIVDEYHLHDSREMWSVFDTGMGAREQPLLLTTTTAGFTLGGACHEYRNDLIKMLRGEYEDETTFALIYEPDEGDDWSDFEVWRKVNPNIGVTVSEEYLQSQLDQARRSADKQNEVRTKNLSEWVGSKAAFMNMLAWQRQKRDIKIEDFYGEECHVAVDLAEQKDASSVVAKFRRGGEYFAFAKHFVPEAAFEWNDRYKVFDLGGHIETTPGNAQDYGAIRKHIDWLAKNFNVKSVRFDPFQAAQLMQELMETGLTVQKQKQGWHLSDAMKTLETEVLDGKLFHSGDPVLTWMVGNTAAVKSRDDHMKPWKDNPNNPQCKIDGCVALIMATQAWNEEEPDYFDAFLANPVGLA